MCSIIGVGIRFHFALNFTVYVKTKAHDGHFTVKSRNLDMSSGVLNGYPP